MSELSYREHVGLNQSYLKKVIRGPAYAQKEEEDNGQVHFVLGQYVEDLTFDVDTSHYIPFTFPSKTTNLGKSCWAMYQWFLDHEGNWPTVEQYEGIYEEIGIKRPSSAELLTNSLETLQDIQSITLNNFIIDEEVKSKAEYASGKIKDDVLTSPLLKSDNEFQSLIKVPIYWNHDDDESTLCKGEIDLLRVNHTKRTVRIIDIKTLSYDVYNLDINFWKFRYDFQLAYYNYGLSRSSFFSENFEGYTILQPMIICVDFFTPAPLLYRLKEETLALGEHGGISPRGYNIKGFRQAIDEYKFYEQYGYRYPKEYVVNKYLEI